MRRENNISFGHDECVPCVSSERFSVCIYDRKGYLVCVRTVHYIMCDDHFKKVLLRRSSFLTYNLSSSSRQVSALERLNSFKVER